MGEKFLLTALFVFFIPFAAGSVDLTHSYYTGDTIVREEFYMENIDWNNVVDITSGDLIETGEAKSSDDKEGKFSEQIRTDTIGASLSLDSAHISAQKSFYAGRLSDTLSVSYSHSFGVSDASFYNHYTSASHYLAFQEGEYSGSLRVQESGISLQGDGFRHASGADLVPVASLYQQLSLTHNGKTIDTDLSLTETSMEGAPLSFDWSNFIGSSGEILARSAVDFSLEHEGRTADFSMVGKSYISPQLKETVYAESEGTETEEKWWIYYLIQ